jgi:hypothetical protein
MMDRDKKFQEAVKNTMEENKELLEKLKDYDERGIPYWEQQMHD